MEIDRIKVVARLLKEMSRDKDKFSVGERQVLEDGSALAQAAALPSPKEGEEAFEALRRHAVHKVNTGFWGADFFQCDLCGSKWDSGKTPQMHTAACLISRLETPTAALQSQGQEGPQWKHVGYQYKYADGYWRSEYTYNGMQPVAWRYLYAGEESTSGSVKTSPDVQEAG